ncbi:MAG TPA: response regulator [Candidatus Obscuribacterales bacterium]
MNVPLRKNGHEPVVNQRLVLLAEDHPLNQKVALLLLERMGFTVHVVNNGVEAVRAASRIDYDAILMDCHMPEIDGFEATKQIREAEKQTDKHVPIIAVTALAMAGDRERCLAAGMDDYLTKPIDRELLHQKLVYWMNPGAVSAVRNSAKVVQMFDAAYSNGDNKDEPVNTAQLYDAYGEEAADLILLFSNSSERIVGELDEAIKESDSRKIARLSHELKGASWAVGAEEMARLSVFLEQAACQENWRLTQRTFVRLRHHFDEVQSFVQKKLGRNTSSSVQR